MGRGAARVRGAGVGGLRAPGMSSSALRSLSGRALRRLRRRHGLKDALSRSSSRDSARLSAADQRHSCPTPQALRRRPGAPFRGEAGDVAVGIIFRPWEAPVEEQVRGVLEAPLAELLHGVSSVGEAVVVAPDAADARHVCNNPVQPLGDSRRARGPGHRRSRAAQRCTRDAARFEYEALQGARSGVVFRPGMKTRKGRTSAQEGSTGERERGREPSAEASHCHTKILPDLRPPRSRCNSAETAVVIVQLSPVLLVHGSTNCYSRAAFAPLKASDSAALCHSELFLERRSTFSRGVAGTRKR